MKLPPDKRRTRNNWWLVGGALLLGYYVGQDPSQTGQQAHIAQETIAPVVQPASTYHAPASSPSLAAPEEDGSDVIADEPSEADPLIAEVESSEASEEVASSLPFSSVPASQGGPEAKPDTALADAENEIDFAEAAAAVGVAVAASPSRPSPSYQQAPPPSPTLPYLSLSSGRTNVGVAPATNCQGAGCYGVISSATGLPRTQYVRGYTRRDGTYVSGYYRSRRR